ncbi:PREDICTED: uncharacterized protein LOC108370146 isoform X2 [Rhagoletis zephyria]|nr:PREDICTED: uncharacterized protein LOC108370146 isoform X2 [Rhagoletis zephyria]
MPLDDIPPIELTKLHFSEIKQDICVEFGVIAGDNDIALHSSNNHLIILDLLDSTALLADLPYNISYAEIPQNYDFIALKKASLKTSNKNCNLLDMQRLALEPSYVSNYFCEPPKLNALQFKRAPLHSCVEQPIAVILTASGLCRVLQKNSAPNRQWSEIFNVNEYLSNELTSSNAYSCSDFNQECCINAATWHTTEPILFVSFGSGYISALRFRNAYIPALNDFFISRTNLEKVCDIICFDYCLVASCRDGILRIFSLNNLGSNLNLLSPLAVLWDKQDNIICNLIHMKKFLPNMYLVVFNKGSYLLVCMLSVKGKVLCSKKLHIGGIKVTGVQLISTSEFIVTTAMSYVRYFRVNFLEPNELKINEQLIKVDLDTSNLEIIGVMPSYNSSLLIFILHRSGEYSQRSNYMHGSIFVNISKLENKGIPKSAPTTDLGDMSQSHAFSIASGLHTFNKCSFFPDVININLPVMLDEGVLLQLQAKYLLISNLLNSNR